MNTFTKQQWIAEQAREHPQRVFTSLHHLIDGEWMREAYRRTRKDGATGIDGVTAADYEKDLEANLDDLLDRMKSGRYFAPPVRRHYIPKADGTKRPLGIPTFEDKVAQRAILMLLEPIYEADFLPCSYGFRPGRSAHDALNALRAGIIEQRQRWVIDADYCFSHFLVEPPRELAGLFRRRIARDDGAIREAVGADGVAFSVNRCCSSGEDVGARAASVGKGWASAQHLSMPCPHGPQDAARSAGRVHIVTAGVGVLAAVVSAPLHTREELARAGRLPPGHGRCAASLRDGAYRRGIR